MTDLRYPIGDFAFTGSATPADRARWIDSIAAAPERLRAAVTGLSDPQLDTPYRPGGWTVRQVVHHVVDSHMNAFIRCKLLLTESNPTIKPYDQALWAAGPEYRAPVEGSLRLLELLHERWIRLLRSLTKEQYARTLFHPEGQLEFTLDRVLAMYSWHGEHHVAHITALRTRERW